MVWCIFNDDWQLLRQSLGYDCQYIICFLISAGLGLGTGAIWACPIDWHTSVPSTTVKRKPLGFWNCVENNLIFTSSFNNNKNVSLMVWKYNGS